MPARADCHAAATSLPVTRLAHRVSSRGIDDDVEKVSLWQHKVFVMMNGQQCKRLPRRRPEWWGGDGGAGARSGRGGDGGSGARSGGGGGGGSGARSGGEAMEGRVSSGVRDERRGSAGRKHCDISTNSPGS